MACSLITIYTAATNPDICTSGVAITAYTETSVIPFPTNISQLLYSVPGCSTSPILDEFYFNYLSDNYFYSSGIKSLETPCPTPTPT